MAQLVFRGKRIIVRIDGVYIGAYTNIEDADDALDAYRGVTR